MAKTSSDRQIFLNVAVRAQEWLARKQPHDAELHSRQALGYSVSVSRLQISGRPGLQHMRPFRKLRQSNIARWYVHPPSDSSAGYKGRLTSISQGRFVQYIPQVLLHCLLHELQSMPCCKSLSSSLHDAILFPTLCQIPAGCKGLRSNWITQIPEVFCLFLHPR